MFFLETTENLFTVHEGTAILFSHVGRIYGSMSGFGCKVLKRFGLLLGGGAQREETTCLNAEKPGFFSQQPVLRGGKVLVLSSEPPLLTRGLSLFYRKTIRLSAKQSVHKSLSVERFFFVTLSCSKCFTLTCIHH